MEAVFQTVAAVSLALLFGLFLTTSSDPPPLGTISLDSDGGNAYRLDEPPDYDCQHWLERLNVVYGSSERYVFPYADGQHNDALVVQCPAGWHFVYWLHGNGTGIIPSSRKPDFVIDHNNRDPTSEGGSRSYMEWYNIHQSGSLSCCNRANPIYECACKVVVHCGFDDAEEEEKREKDVRPVVATATGHVSKTADLGSTKDGQGSLETKKSPQTGSTSNATVLRTWEIVGIVIVVVAASVGFLLAFFRTRSENKINYYVAAAQNEAAEKAALVQPL